MVEEASIMPNILEGCHPNGSERAQLACCRYCWYSFLISKHYPAISVDIHSIETPLDAANRTVLLFFRSWWLSRWLSYCCIPLLNSWTLLNICCLASTRRLQKHGQLMRLITLLAHQNFRIAAMWTQTIWPSLHCSNCSHVSTILDGDEVILHRKL